MVRVGVTQAYVLYFVNLGAAWVEKNVSGSGGGGSGGGGGSVHGVEG